MVPLTRPRVLATCAWILALGLLALLAPGVGREAGALAERIDPADAYLPGIAPLLLYVRLPLAIVGALVLVLGPGLLLAMALAGLRASGSPGSPGSAVRAPGVATVEEWLLRGFALSLVALGTAVPLAQAVLPRGGDELRGAAFVALASALTAGAGIVAWWRAGAGGPAELRPWPRLRGGQALALVGVPLAFGLLLLPKFLWESFNGDGAHAFEATRLLMTRPVPFWDPGSGNVAAYPGMNSVLYLIPGSWFMRLFGENEAGVRLPYLLFLPLLYAGLAAAARQARDEPLSRAAQALLWAGALGFSLVMAYAATYDPYCADVALPATQDALLLACFLALATAFLRGEPGWTASYTACVLLCSPAGPVLVGGWFVAVVLAVRPLSVPRLALLAAGAAAAVVLMAAAPHLLGALGLPAPGGEHGAGNMLQKFATVIPDHVARLGWVLLPCGLYPAAVLLSWRRADGGTRALLLVAGLVLAMYYLMAFVSLHYFAPAMVLPLAAFWRVHRVRDWGPRAGAALAACGLFALVSLGLALPATTAIYTATREVGRSIDASGVEGYDEMTAEAFRSTLLLESLFVPGWTPSVPEEHYAGGALAWNHYAHRPGPEGSPRAPAYALQPRDGRALPPGAELVAEDEHHRLVALDPERWAADRARHPRGSTWRGVWDVPRDILFGRRRARDRYTLIDVKGLVKGLTPKEDPR